MTDSDNVLKQYRETARHCADHLRKKILQDRTDELAAAITRMHDEKSADAMRGLNTAWVRALKAYESCQMATAPTPNGGAMPVEQRLAA